MGRLPTPLSQFFLVGSLTCEFHGMDCGNDQCIDPSRLERCLSKRVCQTTTINAVRDTRRTDNCSTPYRNCGVATRWLASLWSRYVDTVGVLFNPSGHRMYLTACIAHLIPCPRSVHDRDRLIILRTVIPYNSFSILTLAPKSPYLLLFFPCSHST